jgi:L-iditol 2-dehydrogenase
MHAGVYRERAVKSKECPSDVSDGEVLIKVMTCGICGTDIKKIFQAYVNPAVLGHELAARSSP